MSENINFAPQIDYTSRDYTSIRQDLINLIPTYAPNWTNRDPADFGITMIELFSYLGDLLNFYIDRAANEGFLATASQRQSVLQIAGMLGYKPTDTSPARVILTFSNSTGSAITVPAETQVATTTTVDGVSTQVIFETNEEISVLANNSETVAATQGFTVSGESLGNSTGAPNQLIKLNQSPVIRDSIRVFVNGIEYRYSSDLINNTIYDPVFTTINDSEGSTYVLFGDGVGGRIPPTSGLITADYRIGLGAAGNVPANKLTFILSNFTPGLTVNNQNIAFGGADEESTDSIRFNAPNALKALNRAVSLRDYAALALQVPGVSKAIADSNIFTSVNLYIAPFGDPGAIGETTTTVFDEVAVRVSEFFMDKTAPNVTLTVLPPEYVEFDLDVTLNILPQYRQDLVVNQAILAIRELFSFEASFFADRITVQYILSALSAVPGLDYATVDLLRRTEDAQVFSITNKALTGNVATLTTSVAHNLTIGQKVKISGVDDTFNGVHVVTGTPLATTFTFVKVYDGTISSTAVSPNGTAKVLEVDTIVCALNEIPREGTLTIVQVGGIS
jgi:hypothetical protein